MSLRFLDAHSPAGLTYEMGGKGRNLYQLSQAGVPVPEWFCLAASSFEACLPALAERLQGLQAQSWSEAAQAYIAEAFPQQAMEQAFAERLQAGQMYAVRSSGLAEDAQQDSFAGQYETYLYVPAEQVASHILRCWQSAFSVRLWHYLQQRQLQPLPLAVVIQQMVPSQGAGVLFTANPVGALTEVVINAAWGLGEGVVSDQVAADTYRYARESRQWQFEVLPKAFQIQAGHFGGTEKIPVPPEQAEKAVLDSEQCQTLLEWGEKLEALYGHPQDIEWAIDSQGQFWILQTRPITTIATGSKTLFDNSNVVESYPGMTSPLTFSYIRGAYEVLFRNSVIRLGVPRKQVFEHQQVFKNMLGHLQGRVYYNLSNWYRMFRLVPGTEPYIRVWEEMMGIRQPNTAQGPRFQLVWLWPWLQMACRLLWTFVRLDATLKAFRRHFQAVSEDFWGQPHPQLTAHQLLNLYQQLCSRLLYGWEITVINDGYAFIFSGLSKSLLQRLGFVESQTLFNDLLCGVAGMESVEPVRSVVAMAEMVRQQPALQQALQAQMQQWQPQLLQHEHPLFAQQLNQHLAQFGDRCLAELKLETETLRDNPRLLLRWILDYSETQLTGAGMQAHETSIRLSAEARLKAARANPLLKLALRYCLAQARRCINYREASRLDRARSFGMVRRIFRVLGQQLEAQKQLLDAEDIFWLSLEELQALVTGAGPVYDWRGLVQQRQQQYLHWEQQALPERILCQGPVGNHLLPLRRRRTPDSVQHLSGTGCAPGLVTAEALVVRNPAEVQQVSGKILIAEMTDPGWVFLMIQAAGLVVEKGSLLSHTAIIGRELGIPTIVGVKAATERLQTGQTLRINGQTGEVEILT